MSSILSLCGNLQTSIDVYKRALNMINFSITEPMFSLRTLCLPGVSWERENEQNLRFFAD